jgi:phosphomannomutase
MPLVQIDVLHGHSVAYRRAILDGVHVALVECFKIPDQDRHQINPDCEECKDLAIWSRSQK